MAQVNKIPIGYTIKSEITPKKDNKRRNLQKGIKNQQRD